MLNQKMKAAAILLGVAVVYGCSGYDQPADETPKAEAAGPVYTIEGQPVQLDVMGENGIVSLLESATGDLNNDGRDDRGIVLRERSRGTGVFYFLNVFLDDGNGGWQFVGEEFLGDRIKFDFIDIYGEGSVSQLTGVPIHPDDYGQLVVAYATHTIEQSFVEEPGNYLTRHFKVQDGSLVTLEAD